MSELNTETTVEFFVEQLDDAGAWSQASVPITNEDMADFMISTYRKSNPKRKFRLVRVTTTFEVISHENRD